MMSEPEENGIKVAEMFSVAGGFSAILGKSFAPFLAIDNDRRAREVYTGNRPEVNFVCEDVTKIKDFRSLGNNRPDILLAGPPCQGFSPVGMKTKRSLSLAKEYDPSSDPRNHLPLEISRAATQIRPKMIIIENVPAMRTHFISHKGDLKLVTDVLQEQLSELGYSILGPFVIDSYDIGIPQKRKRAFVMASLEYSLKQSEMDLVLRRAKDAVQHASLKKAIADLQHVPVTSARETGTPGFPDHVSRTPNPDDLRIISNLMQGENYASLVERMPEVVQGRKHRTYNTSSFRDKFYRLKWNEPSRTIVAHLQKDGNSYIHPSLDRSISVREAARIQSFPDTFLFGIPMSPAFRLVGNAVPPLLGKFLAEVFSRMTGLLSEKSAEMSQFAGLVS